MDTIYSVNTVEMEGADRTSTLGIYGNGRVGLNSNFTDIKKMNSVYDASVKSGFHPSRGKLSGTEAVALHETGHALTDHVAKKMGHGNLDKAAKTIVNNAYRATGGKGNATKSWASKISGYAKENFSECVAEAVADYYCNGKKAKSQSHAIMKELRKYK